MYKWVERNTLPDYTHEMLHYRNAMVSEINFAFSDSFAKAKDDTTLQEKYENLKDFREKTANRIKRDSERAKIWLDMLLDLFRNTLDFTSADLFLKYFNIPNDAIFTDLYFIMKQPKSIYQGLVKEQALQSAFDFLQFFPQGEAIAEYGKLIHEAINHKNTEAFMSLAEHMPVTPFDRLLNDDEIVSLMKKEYERAETEKRIADAKKLSDILRDTDLINRIYALEAMMNKRSEDAINYIKAIKNTGNFKQVIKEYYSSAMKLGQENQNIDLYKTAYSYAYYGKLFSEGDRKFLEEPAGKLFSHFISKEPLTDNDMYEAEQYIDDCNQQTLQDGVAKKVLALINNNEKKRAKHLIARFKVEFVPGEYKAEGEIREYYDNLIQTSGTLDVPKGEENLMTAMDIAEIFKFANEDIDELKFMTCRFYLVNNLIEKAKKYYNEENRELRELVVKQLMTAISTKKFKEAYDIGDNMPIKMTREIRMSKIRDIKGLTQGEDPKPDNIAMAIVIDDLFGLKKLPRSFFAQTFEFGLNGGTAGVDLLVDLSTTFKRHINACHKVELSRKIKRLLVEDKASAEVLHNAYKKYSQPDIFDFIIYLLRKILGAC